MYFSLWERNNFASEYYGSFGISFFPSFALVSSPPKSRLVPFLTGDKGNFGFALGEHFSFLFSPPFPPRRKAGETYHLFVLSLSFSQWGEIFLPEPQPQPMVLKGVLLSSL